MPDEVPPGKSDSPCERPAFEDVYRDQAPYVARLLRRFGVAKRDVEDAMHEVFMVVLRRLPAFEPGSIKPWQVAIICRVATKFRDKHKRMSFAADVPRVEEGSSVEQQQRDPETEHLLRELALRLLDSVDPERRIVFVRITFLSMAATLLAWARPPAPGTGCARARRDQADARRDHAGEAACRDASRGKRANNSPSATHGRPSCRAMSRARAPCSRR